jgi:DNA-binding SARP family transcriptional activator
MVWGDAPPAGAHTTVRGYVKRLRRVLGPAAGGRIITCAPGYLIEAATDEVDLLRFDMLVGNGGTAVRSGNWRQASDVLNEALGLWRGELAAELRDLSQLLPMRERFHAQLMLALYRSGRRGEALDVFRKARGSLVAELGVERGSR